MTNTRKTKTEILQELESIKHLLQESEDIPLLQEAFNPQGVNPQALPGQGYLFDEPQSAAADAIPSSTLSAMQNPRAKAKAIGENPFLPQHIRDRLQGNNPPPLFNENTLALPSNASGKSRLQLINELMTQLQPTLERELRQKLFSLSEQELERLLNEPQESLAPI